MTREEAIKLLHRDTTREAIAELKYYAGFNKEKTIEQIQEAMDMGAEALEKQIPKKPNKAIDSSWGIKKEAHVCPICDYYLTEVYFIAPQKIEPNKKITYCEICGQAIDWSEEE